MIKYLKTPISIVLLTLVVIIGTLSLGLSSPKIASSDALNPNFIQTMSTVSFATVSTASTPILNASSGRVYAVFVNDGTVPIYLRLASGSAVADSGIRLNASGGSYEINPANLYVGAISAVTASGSAVLTITAKQ